MKFLKRILSASASLWQAILRFPVVFSCLVAASVILTVSSTNYFDHQRLLICLILIAVMCATRQILSESMSRKPIKTLIDKAFAVGIGVMYYFLMARVMQNDEQFFFQTLLLCLAGGIAFLIYQSYRNHLLFHEIFIVFFKAVFYAALIAGVVFGGVILLLGAINELLVSLPSWTFTLVSCIAWIVLMPMLALSYFPVFSSASEKKIEAAKHIPKLMVILVNYVLIPILGLFTLVFIIYIIRTFLPQGDRTLLEPMLISYSTAIVVLWFLARPQENNVSTLFCLVAPKLLLPIAVFQLLVSVQLTVLSGVAIGRYYAMMFAVFALIAGVLLSFNKRPKQLVLPILLAVLLALSSLPFVGSYDVTAQSQTALFYKNAQAYGLLHDGAIVPQFDVPQKARENIFRAVQTLSDMGQIERIEELDQDFNVWIDFEQVFGFSPYADTSDPSDAIWFRLVDGPIQITSYDYMIASRAIMITKTQDYVIDEAPVETTFSIDGIIYTLQISRTRDGDIYTLFDDAKNKDLEIVASDALFAVVERLEATYDMSDTNSKVTIISVEEASYIASGNDLELTLLFNGIDLNGKGTDQFVYANYYVFVSRR